MYAENLQDVLRRESSRVSCPVQNDPDTVNMIYLSAAVERARFSKTFDMILETPMKPVMAEKRRGSGIVSECKC
jgi:hypothetical protein